MTEEEIYENYCRNIVVDDTDSEKNSIEYYINSNKLFKHVISDEWYYENSEDFSNACCEIIDGLESLRIFCHASNDWGSLKVESVLGGLWDGSIRWLLKLADTNEHNSWYDKIDRKIQKFFLKSGILKKVQDWQKEEVNKLYQKVCLKYPRLVNELVMNSDFYDWIKPGKYGPINGRFIRNKNLSNMASIQINNELNSL